MASGPARLSVVGAGRLGRTLARLWADAGHFRIAAVACRTPVAAAAAAAFIGQGAACDRLQGLEPADAWLLGVPDDRLAGVAADLAASGAVRPGCVAWHCSGAHDAGLLAPLRDAGAHVASAHPMHSFADPAASLASFRGSWCALEGEPAALAVVRPAFSVLGARCVELDPRHKLLYHAAGVLAANGLVALLGRAGELLRAAGIPATDALPLLEPLVRGSVDNLFRDGPQAALTGPVARGDAALVARQLDAVARLDPAQGELYRALGLAALALAEARGGLEPARIAALREALGAPAHGHG